MSDIVGRCPLELMSVSDPNLIDVFNFELYSASVLQN